MLFRSLRGKPVAAPTPVSLPAPPPQVQLPFPKGKGIYLHPAAARAVHSAAPERSTGGPGAGMKTIVNLKSIDDPRPSQVTPTRSPSRDPDGPGGLSRRPCKSYIFFVSLPG